MSVMLLLGAAPSARAQEAITIRADFLFYGDNTESANLFREGETLLGNSGQVVVATDIGGGRAVLRGGVFGDRRFGSETAFELVRPVFALDLHAGASRFTMGTLETTQAPAFGPDRAGPHGLLPPIQRDTIGFTRPYEAGLQWTYRARRVSHEFWVDWQRLNTPAAREVFDSGINGTLSLTEHAAFAYQSHIVHHGGQLFSNGPVADSYVGAPGIIFSGESRLHPSLELYGLVSRYVPDRERTDRATSGAAVFTRAALHNNRWRVHLIVWRSNDFIKEEGDPNYGGLRRDGRRFRKPRDYGEFGVTRVARLAPQLQLEGDARLHRVESHYEYSYRILGRVDVSWRVR